MEPFVWLRFLAPYQFSALVVVSTVVVLVLYLRGLRAARRGGQHVSIGRRAAFFVGVGLCYAVLHTGIDYYAQYVFFIHRLQHLVLHHAGPFLIALAAPWSVLALGIPRELCERWLQPAWRSSAAQLLYRFVQHPVVAPLLFVGLIFFWLTPEIHFDAMLSLTLYHVMNWSMLIDGLLFWWLMLNPHPTGRSAVLSYGTRVLILFVIMPPQIALGAYIALSGQDLYDVYAVCGRAWPIDAATDQQLGGLFTWIPAAMMSVMGILLVINFMMRHERQADASSGTDAELTARLSGH